MKNLSPSFGQANAVINLDHFCGAGRQNDADNIFNDVLSFALKTDAFDQTGVYGAERDKFHLTFYRKIDGAGAVRTFHFKDFLFSDRAMADVRDTNDFMRALDRNALAGAMRDALIDTFGLPVNEDAPHFWRRDILQCSHPDFMPRTAQRLPEAQSVSLAL